MIVFTGRDKHRFNRLISVPRQVHNHEKCHDSADVQKDVEFIYRIFPLNLCQGWVGAIVAV